MSPTVPDGIAGYFEAGKRRDIDAIVTLFTADAVVVDEGQTWRYRRDSQLAGRPCLALPVHDRGAGDRAHRRGDLPRDRPPRRQLSRWRRRPDMALHRHGRADQPPGNRAMSAPDAGQTPEASATAGPTTFDNRYFVGKRVVVTGG